MSDKNTNDESDVSIDFAASDKPTMKPVRKTGKKQSQKASASQPSTGQASTSQPSTSQASASQLSTSKTSKSQASTSKASKSKASTSKASKSKASTSKASESREFTSKSISETSSTPDSFEVRKRAVSNLPSEKKPSASTSAASSSSSSYDTNFWRKTMESKFQNSGYQNLLRESNFTERQVEVLNNLFHETSRRMHNTFMNSDRVMKIHSCRDCVFSICHHCVSIQYLNAGWASPDAKLATIVAPHTTTICICHFAFFHAHTSRPSLSETVKPENLKRNIVSLRCPVCDTMVMIEHPQVENTNCTLTKWSGINSSDEEAFHAQLDDHIQNFTRETLSLDELYTCNHHCCLFFHRCSN